MPLAAVLDLDETELAAYANAVGEHARRDQWGTIQQLLAEQLKVLDLIRRQLASGGVPTISVKRQRKVGKPIEIQAPGDTPKPASNEIVVTSFRDLMRHL